MFLLKTIFITIILFLTVNLKSQDLQINEVVNKNYNGLQSFEGETEDWIEIYNSSTDTIELHNYYLSDKKSNFNLWQFPYKKLAPDSFLVIFASGENITIPEFHTNFSLKAEGEIIYLSSNVLVDSVIIPSLKADYSFGRISENNYNWKVLDVPSPALSNVNSNSLVFSAVSGFFDKYFYLKINSLRENTIIYYTLNGNDPNESSHVFNDSLLIEDRTYLENSISMIKTTPDDTVYYHNWEEPEPNVKKINSIKFVSYSGSEISSKIHTFNYLIGEQNSALKTICITIDSLDLFSEVDGIYVPGNDYNAYNINGSGNYYSNKRVKTHFSLFDENSKEILNENAQARIMGNATRATAQKSFKFYAKKEFGAKEFNAEVVKDSFLEYNSFVLRSTQGSRLSCMITDDLTMDLVEALDIDFTKTSFCRVFLNGTFWGVQSLRNDLSDDFLQTKYNLEKEDINIIDFNFETLLGNNNSFLNLIDFIKTNDLSYDQNYDRVASELDINSYIDYQIAEMFLNNSDWPGNNSKLWKSNKENSRWRFLFYDLDGSFIEVDKNMLKFCTAENSENWRNLPKFTFLLRNLLKNKHFENQFIKRYVTLLAENFSTENTINYLIKNIDELSPSVQESYDRWVYPKPIQEWINRIEDKFVPFLTERPCVVKEQLESFFNVSSLEIDCSGKIKELLKFKIVPNPNSGTFKLVIDSKISGIKLKYELYDYKGQIIKQDVVLLGFDSVCSFEFDDLLNGIYFLKVIDSNNFYRTEKLIIQQ
jgi:hypothetical protein